MFFKENDLFEFIRRNSKCWDVVRTKKFLDEVNKIQHFLQRKIKSLEEAA